MRYVFIALALAAIAGGVIWYLKRKKSNATAGVLSPLPASDRKCPAIFQAWLGIDAGNAPLRALAPPGTNLRRPTDASTNEAAIAKHAAYWHIPEAFGVFARGRTVMTAPVLTGEYEPNTIPLGLATRARLKALNPNIKLGVQIGYTEGSDATTDIPPNHPWWKRVNGQRVPGWAFGLDPAYLFNLDLPEVLQHCAECCRKAKDTGIWDFLFLDVFNDDIQHVDLLRRIRSLCGDWPIIANCNYSICPNVAPLVNGIMLECGPLTSAAQWAAVIAALDYAERHVIQPAMNCLEISGARDDMDMLLAATCLSLARSNGYVLYADAGPGYASTHAHGWYDLWDIELGKPLESTKAAGTLGSQRLFEHGKVVFNPPPGDSYITTP